MPQKPPLSRLLLHVFLLLTALATLFLLCIGGLVTSTGSGLAVPDWPTSYGYNMFLFPISQWFSDRGIFYEHSHRLVASGVGFMTIILCVWIWVVERARPWLCWLGTAALVLVIIQGVLGGLRVVWLRNEMGLIHACLAQGFFVLVCFLALVTSPAWWRMWEKPPGTSSKCVGGFIKWSLALTLLIYVQLMVGAGMRHAHAGLAIPDWPLAYGQVWPKTDPATLKSLNEKRWEVRQMPTTAVQIHLQMLHRLFAYALVVCIPLLCLGLFRSGADATTRGQAALWSLLVVVQAVLGVATILSNKAADIATLHVAVGALTLATGALLTVVLKVTSRVSQTQSDGEAPTMPGREALTS